jgi:opacity protein-like surface antigen
MKKITILLLLLCNAFIAQAQNRFSAGIAFGPQLSSMKITRPYTSPFLSGVQESGGVGIGYFAGVQLEYNFMKNFFVRSGMNYQITTHQYRVLGLEFTNEKGVSFQGVFMNDMQVNSIDLPLDLGYRIETNSEKINVVVGVGGVLHTSVKTKSSGVVKNTNSEVEEPIVITESQVTASPYSAVFFGGLEFQISKHFGLAIEPFLKYTPNKFELFIFKSEAKTNLETGLTCRLRFM